VTQKSNDPRAHDGQLDNGQQDVANLSRQYFGQQKQQPPNERTATNLKRVASEDVKRYENFFNAYVPPKKEPTRGKIFTITKEEPPPLASTPDEPVKKPSSTQTPVVGEKNYDNVNTTLYAEAPTPEDDEDFIYLEALLNNNMTQNKRSISSLLAEIVDNEKVSISNYESSVFDANVQQLFDEEETLRRARQPEITPSAPAVKLATPVAKVEPAVGKPPIPVVPDIPIPTLTAVSPVPEVSEVTPVVIPEIPVVAPISVTPIPVVDTPSVITEVPVASVSDVAPIPAPVMDAPPLMADVSPVTPPLFAPPPQMTQMATPDVAVPVAAPIAVPEETPLRNKVKKQPKTKVTVDTPAKDAKAVKSKKVKRMLIDIGLILVIVAIITLLIVHFRDSLPFNLPFTS